MVTKHFDFGAAYPRGGARVVSEALLANVLENNGNVVISATVENLIMDNGTCKGVKLASGEEFFAKNIISGTGA